MPMTLGLGLGLTNRAASGSAPAVPTYGAAVSADLGNTGTLSGKTVGFLPYANWSNPSGTPNFAATNLIDNTGAATTLDLTLANAAGNVATRSADDTTDNWEIFGRGVGVQNTTTTLTIAQIPYAKYDVIVYFDETSTSISSDTLDVSDGTTTYYAQAAVAGRWAGSFVRLTSLNSGARQSTGNYVLFQNKTTASLTISAIATPNAGRFILTGIQFVERTDPF